MNKTVKVFFVSFLLFNFFNGVVFAASSTSSDAVGGIFAVLSTFFSIFCSCFCYCIPAIIGLSFLVLEIFMIIDLIKRDEKDFGSGENAKLMWLLIVLLTGYIGTVIYYFMIYSKFRKKK